MQQRAEVHEIRGRAPARLAVQVIRKRPPGLGLERERIDTPEHMPYRARRQRDFEDGALFPDGRSGDREVHGVPSEGGLEVNGTEVVAGGRAGDDRVVGILAREAGDLELRDFIQIRRAARAPEHLEGIAPVHERGRGAHQHDGRRRHGREVAERATARS
jgi:hypothetical protein